MMLPRRRFADMTTAEIAAADTASWVAVIPVAAIEQHGPHLPLSTDSVIGEALLERALALLPGDADITALPMVMVGASDEHVAFPGTLTHRPETLAEVLVDLGESLLRAGIRRLLFINSHGGNGPTLDGVTRELRIRSGALVVMTSFSRFGVPDGIFPPSEIAYGIHGGAIETALMMHFRPELVRTDRIAAFPSLQERLVRENRHLRAYGPVSFGWLAGDLNPAGVVGDATLATAAKGRAIAEHQAARFAELCLEVAAFDLNLLSSGGASGTS